MSSQMASCGSFRNQSGARPPRYRTPSPPRDAIEPLSPHPSPTRLKASSDSRPVQTPHPAPKLKGISRPTDDRSDYQYPPLSNGDLPGKMGNHSRSGSTIDTLATIALATSPTFAPQTDNKMEDSKAPDAMSHIFSDPDKAVERPPKRARSEKAPSPTWQRAEERPATSHTSTFDSMKTDAELLLNFARPNNNNNSSPSYYKPRKDNEFNNSRNADPKRSAAFRRSHGSSRDATHDKTSSAFISGSTGSARMRSRSDGSTMVSRPLINGFADRQTAFLGPAVEEESKTDGQRPVTVAFDVPPKTAQPPMPEPAPAASSTRKRARPSNPAPETEIESDSSGQAQCASCNLVKVPEDGEDDTEVTWVNCDGCDRWVHIVCAGFKDYREIRTVDKFICRECRPTYGPTTFLRKSSRPRTAIDYAGLNQGFVKSSAEAPAHHYIRPIKEGKISFLPDNFARLPPELVSAEYFQHGVGMKEPIVIPSYLNPRSPGNDLGHADNSVPSDECASQEEFDDLIEQLEARERISEEVINCGQDLLDMVIPDNLTVRSATELYGPDETVEVIDVKSQQGEDKKWTMQKWADYYYESNSTKPIRNVISLEVSQSPLGRLIRRPKIVRDLDLQDSVWPADLQAIGDHPKVQFYCLMSVADCYTDFHVDFGGSSVFYQILKGKKTFFFIPPKDKHLKKYEEWCNSSSQDSTFLGDLTKECYRVDISEGDTMLIPSGWIHAVWTPENSLVIGGNFLTRMNYAMQIKVAKIEKDTKVPMKFRYPFFQKIMWYTALKYLAEDPVPPNVVESFAQDENYRFYREYPIYYEFGDNANTTEPGSAYYNARFYSQVELDGLPELARYLFRTALIAGGYNVDGVAKEARNAVGRSIPKGQGDPISIVQKFAVWLAWKRGNEPAAEWTRPGFITMDTKFDLSEKKSNGRPNRRSERKTRPARTGLNSSVQFSDQRPAAMNGALNGSSPAPDSNSTSVPAKRKAPVDTNNGMADSGRVMSKNAGLGPKRVACEACRKRRIRCRHKDEDYPLEMADLKQSVGDTVHLTGSENAGMPVNPSVYANRGVDDDLASSHAEYPNSKSPPGVSDSVQNNSGNMNGNTYGTLYPAKKGRSKACDECRKSKRRCIHDEAGRIDPQKAQERSKPRTSGTSWKPPPSSDEGKSGSPLTSRDTKMKDDVPEGTQKPVAEDHSTTSQSWTKPSDSTPIPAKADKNALRGGLEPTQVLYAYPPALDSIPPAANDHAPAAPVAAATSLVSPPTSLSDDNEHVPVPDGQMSILETSSHPPQLTTGTATSTAGHRKTSRQPEDARPASPATEKGGPEVRGSTKRSTSRAVSSSTADRRDSVQTSHEERKDFESDEKEAAVEYTRHQDAIPASPTRHLKAEKHDRIDTSEMGADPESLRLIKELQGQEFGLRRRATRS